MSASSGPHPIRRAVAVTLLVPACVAMTACAGNPHVAPTPDPQGLALPCSDAYLVGPDVEIPARIRVSNQTGSDLLLSLDQCVQSRHLGWVRSGTVTTLDLPKRLVAFDGSLRVHAYDVASDKEVASFDVAPVGWVARLVIPESAVPTPQNR